MNNMTWRVQANSPTAVTCMTVTGTTTIMIKGIRIDYLRAERGQGKEEEQKQRKCTSGRFYIKLYTTN